MIPYILHVTVITTICFLFYKLLLQKETHYRLNRWTLMGCLAVSFALPLLPVPKEWSWQDKWKEEVAARADMAPVVSRADQYLPKPEARVNAESGWTNESQEMVGEEPTTNNSKEALYSQPEKVVAHHRKAVSVTPVVSASNVDAVPNFQAHDSKDNTATGTPVEKKDAGTLATFFSGVTLVLIIQWIFYCYLFGVVLFGINFLLQLAVLLYQSYSRPVIRDGRFRIVEISGNRAPCSFGNTIFINPENYDWETYNQILIHEKIHVSGGHTLDILLAEIALVIQWFNPFAWLYRREVENNLEFLTDANVLLHRDVERSAYQLSLLRVSAPHLPFSITNNYNQSLLKRRIVMMNSKRSSLHTVWKYFFLIPLLTGLMCALNKPVAALAETTRKLPLMDALHFNLSRFAADTTKRPAKHTDSLAGTHAAVKPAGSSNGDNDSEGSGASSGFGDAQSYSQAQSYGNASYGGESDARTISLQDMNNASFNTAVTLQPSMNLQLQPIQLHTKAVALKSGMNLSTLSDIDTRVNFKLKGVDYVDAGRFSDTVLTDGSWYATSFDNKISFELKAGDDDHYWSNTIRVDKSEINPFPGQGTVEFKLVREAGTIVFKGQFDGQEGFGHFHYTPDAAYLPALKALGVEDLEDRRQFAFFANNVKKDYVEMVVHNGYPHISMRDLLGFASMHIDLAFIQLWHGTYIADADASEPRNLIRLKAMHIDHEYVDELKAAGYDHLSLRELESMKAQHIDRAYIRSIGRGSDNQVIPVRDLVSYKAMRIDSNYLSELRKLGYGNLTMREVTALYSQHVTPEFIKSMQESGYKELSARDLSMLKAMNVTPEYVKGFRDAGYNDMAARTIIRFKSQDVTPEFIKGFTDLGYSGLTANELASLKAMNITPEYVKEFNKLGFDNIPVRLLTSLKSTGVSPEYVSKMKSQGFISKDLSKYIRLKNDFN